jgi:hypothetical protein
MKSRPILTLPASFTHRDINGLGRLSEWGDYPSANAVTTTIRATVAAGINQLEYGSSSLWSEGEEVGTAFFSRHLGPGPRM